MHSQEEWWKIQVPSVWTGGWKKKLNEEIESLTTMISLRDIEIAVLKTASAKGGEVGKSLENELYTENTPL